MLLKVVRRATQWPPVPPVPLPIRPEPDQSRSDKRLIFLVEDDVEQAESLAIHRRYDYGVRILDRLDGLAAEVEKDRPDALIVTMTFAEGPLAGAAAVSRLHRPRAYGAPPRIVFLSLRSDLEARLAALGPAARPTSPGRWT